MIAWSSMSSQRGRDRDPIAFIQTFGDLWRCLMSLSTQTYATEKLGSTQARFLRHIGQHTGISQAELARATDTDPTVTGRALKTLLLRGWVRRKRSKEDLREYVLELGAAGQRARGRAEVARARFAARVARVLDETDLEDFDRIAKKLFDAFKDYADDGSPPTSNPRDPPKPSKESPR
jgi:DNA-binding MarR family transcriptional regulator